MSGTITHSWNGTVLTIQSDSGTSSADLKGTKGDTGPRGAQGKPGVVLNSDGTVDMTAYATESYVDTKIAEVEAGEVDLSDYYTKSEINNKGYLTQHQTLKTINGESLVGTGDIPISGETDLTDYYTKSQVDAKIPDTTAFATRIWVEAKIPTKVSDLTNDSGYLTEHQSLKTINGQSIVGSGDITISGGSSIDLSDYYTKEQIDAKGYLTSHQSLAEYAKKTEIPDVSGFQTAAQVQTLIDNALGVIENGSY